MKNVILITGTIVGLLAASAFALQLPSTDADFEARGEVVEVSSDAGTLTLREDAEMEDLMPGAKQSGVVRDFVIDDATKLTASGETVNLEDVHVGARATIHYVLDAGKNIAKSIEIEYTATE